MIKICGALVLLSIAANGAATHYFQSDETRASGGAAKAVASCINFSQASTFKTVDGDTIRLTAAGRDYEVDMTGGSSSPAPATVNASPSGLLNCASLDKAKGLAIQSAPSLALCPGEEYGGHGLKFSADGQSEPLRCKIKAIRTMAAEPNTAK